MSELVGMTAYVVKRRDLLEAFFRLRTCLALMRADLFLDEELLDDLTSFENGLEYISKLFGISFYTIINELYELDLKHSTDECQITKSFIKKEKNVEDAESMMWIRINCFLVDEFDHNKRQIELEKSKSSNPEEALFTEFWRKEAFDSLKELTKYDMQVFDRHICQILENRRFNYKLGKLPEATHPAIRQLTNDVFNDLDSINKLYFTDEAVRSDFSDQLFAFLKRFVQRNRPFHSLDFKTVIINLSKVINLSKAPKSLYSLPTYEDIAAAARIEETTCHKLDDSLSSQLTGQIDHMRNYNERFNPLLPMPSWMPSDRIYGPVDVDYNKINHSLDIQMCDSNGKRCIYRVYPGTELYKIRSIPTPVVNSLSYKRIYLVSDLHDLVFAKCYDVFTEAPTTESIDQYAKKLKEILGAKLNAEILRKLTKVVLDHHACLFDREFVERWYSDQLQKDESPTPTNQ